VKLIFASIIFITFTQCDKNKNIICKKQFYECANICSDICSRTIKKKYEFGKCFSTCNKPCRKEYCEEIVKS
jgi:hypothetical protein